MANGDEAADQRRAVMRLMLGYMASHALGAAARTGLVDLIGDGRRSAEDLAGDLGLPQQSASRLMRALAALGLLTEEEPGRFGVSGAGALLRSDRPDSVRGMVRMFTDPAMMRAWEGIDESLRTGETSFDRMFGTDFFSHLGTDPELSALFNTAMSQGTRSVADALPARYEFASAAAVMDIGGGDGTLIAAVLGANPGMRGTVFDTAEGAAQAPGRLEEAGVADRCTVAAGDFFEGVPAGADVYLLKSIVHDWDDRRAATILSHVRAVVPDHGRLLIVEPVLPATVPPEGFSGLYLTDLNMLVNVGGRERTRDDFDALCAASGFAVSDVVPLAAGFSAIEAVPV
ncbi:methyltransferase [Streptomonospora halophila]